MPGVVEGWAEIVGAGEKRKTRTLCQPTVVDRQNIHPGSDPIIEGESNRTLGPDFRIVVVVVAADGVVVVDKTVVAVMPAWKTSHVDVVPNSS